MARMTAEERAQLKALNERAKAEDEADSDLEVWAENNEGHRIKLTGADARAYRRKFGLDADDEEAEEAEESDEEAKGGKGKGAAGYLKRKAA